MLQCSGKAPTLALATASNGKCAVRPFIARRPRISPRCSANGAQAAAPAAAGTAGFHYTQLEIETQPGISLFDITPAIREHIARLGVQEGCVNVLSRHTTTAVVINEYETRLLDDCRQFFRQMAPPTAPYLHNDLHLREAPENWPGGWKAWAEQEPENAHSHLLSMVLGNSETVPITGGKLALGTWQSVLLVELDGPRKRTVGVQIMGIQQQNSQS